jgi:MFS family permease
VAGRLLTGWGTGVAGVVVPSYLGETSPAPYRGTLGALFNLGITTGVWGVGALSYLGVGWRPLAYAFGTLPQLMVLVCCASEARFPETPEHLAATAAAHATVSTRARLRLCEALYTCLPWRAGGVG